MALTLANFKQIIDSAIQQRGQSYFANGRVIQLIEIDTGHWQAVVEGADRYWVEISIAPDGALDWTCDCPYGWGPVCKHVAAVLYALEDAPSSSESNPSAPSATDRSRKSRADKVRDALDTLSGDQLYDLLLELVLKDRELTNLVLARYGLEEHGEKAYRELVKDALSVGQGRYGFLDYRGASKAAKRVGLLLGRANLYVVQGQPAQAISIYQAVVEEVVEAVAQADDSAGALSGCVSSALNGFLQVAEQLTPAARKELFGYCLTEAPKERYSGWDWRWDLVNIAAELMVTRQQRSALVATLDQLATTNEAEGWIAEYAQERAAEIKLAVIRRHDSDEEVQAFLEEHVQHERLRMALARMHLDQGDLTAARQVCEEWLDRPDPSKPGLRRDFLAILLDVAKVSGDQAEQIRLADMLFLDTGRFEYYESLKELIGPAKWADYRPDFLQRAKTNQRSWVYIADLYMAEEMWDALLTYVQNQPEAAPYYNQELGQHFPLELSAVYERLAQKTLADRANREGYREACGYLQQMQELGQGERVTELVAQWRELYPRRRALLEELNKVFGS